MKPQGKKAMGQETSVEPLSNPYAKIFQLFLQPSRPVAACATAPKSDFIGMTPLKILHLCSPLSLPKTAASPSKSQIDYSIIDRCPLRNYDTSRN